MFLLSFVKLSYLFFILLLGLGGVMMFYSLGFYTSMKLVFIEWLIFEYNGVEVIMTLLLDWMSLMFMGVVFLISSMVMVYSSSYMSSDKSISRFIMLVFLFVTSMALLIISPNLISLLLGWDGLGLVSYCLVIYYQNEKSANAGLLTVLSNRIGDIGLLFAISWLMNFGSWNFYYLAYAFSDSNFIIKLILLLVVLAALTKSAQIPFSAWLPAAMAAPTPVSSLVHSSTLVTAGVYLLIRFSELLNVNNYLLLISVSTMVMSGIGANFEMDLKKVIALSTLSQLGVMMMSLSLGLKELAFFHLITHALFKSLLFLCAGVFIHSWMDTQDIRSIGGVGKILPLSSLYFSGCSLSLCGFPFLAGFYSKDLIIEMFFMSWMNLLIFIMLVLGTMMTLTYSLRLVYYIYMKNLGRVVYLSGIKEDLIMYTPMGNLFMISIFAGSLFNWLFIPHLSIILPSLLKFLIITLMVLFLMSMFLVMQEQMLLLYQMFSIRVIAFLGSMWNLPSLSTILFMPFIKQGSMMMKLLDLGWLEYYGGQGIYNNLNRVSSLGDVWNYLGVKTYLLLTFVLVVVFLLV